MSDTQQLPLSVQPVISYPREAQVGKTYLMTIDLETNGKWVYEKEEYSIYCMLDVSFQETPLFSIKTIGEPAIVLHRFGGTYGAAKFLLTAASEEMEGEIKITLVNEWGAPIRVLTLDAVRVVQEVDRISQIIGEYEQEIEVVSTEPLEQEFQETLLTIKEKELTPLEDVLTPNISTESRNLPVGRSLNLAIARLVNAGANNFAIWIVRAPYASGHVFQDCIWTPHLTQVWQEWQQLFAGHSNLDVSPNSDQIDLNLTPTPLPIELPQPIPGQPTNYAGRLMQYFGNCLWQWVFEGSILGSLEHSRGIASGQGKSLRLRLEIRDPYLVSIPWEIMQRPGQAAISLSQNVIFSRTISDAEPLPSLRNDAGLNILLVLGEDENLQLEAEAELLKQTLTQATTNSSDSHGYAPCTVTKFIQPTPDELIACLETCAYNVVFYSLHGLRGPDGGILNLHPKATLNGIELAQVLVRTGVKLAVFNSCWGAQPFSVNRQPVPYSSLAEVLIRHGVPAVLGMRDQIADRESLSFIQAFSEALRSRRAIDKAVADARQKLLSLYKFNQPGWTLPILYMHPEFNGKLVCCDDFNSEQNEVLAGYREEEVGKQLPTAYLRSLSDHTKQLLPAPVTRIGRTTDNNIIIPDLSVSRQHAQIICRDSFTNAELGQNYYLRDDSTGGTLIYQSGTWQRIHHEEVPLISGMQLKFGSSRSDTWEFIIED
jgi:CHAT domain/FHA domain